MREIWRVKIFEVERDLINVGLFTDTEDFSCVDKLIAVLYGALDGGKRKNKRKKDPNSLESDSEKKGTKRVTIDSSQQQPQANGCYFPYGQPMQPLPLVKPYHGPPLSPSQLMSHYTSLASAIPLPKSPEQGLLKGSMSHDILAKIFERLDGMDTTGTVE